MSTQATAAAAHPVQLAIEYPDRDLNRVSTAFRLFALVPIALLLGAIVGITGQTGDGTAEAYVIGGTGLLFLPPFLMIVFRRKYPRWFFDWNVQLMRFSTRVGAYAALMNDRYPSVDDEQYVRLDVAYPDARDGLNRWMPLVKWFLAIPHYVVLAFLYVAAFFAVVAAWFAILFTGRYPRPLFEFVEGVTRWQARVVAYAHILVTDQYPPFRLSA